MSPGRQCVPILYFDRQNLSFLHSIENPQRIYGFQKMILAAICALPCQRRCHRKREIVPIKIERPGIFTVTLFRERPSNPVASLSAKCATRNRAGRCGVYAGRGRKGILLRVFPRFRLRIGFTRNRSHIFFRCARRPMSRTKSRPFLFPLGGERERTARESEGLRHSVPESFGSVNGQAVGLSSSGRYSCQEAREGRRTRCAVPCGRDGSERRPVPRQGRPVGSL